MKVKVIKDAFYNKTLVRDGDVIETNFDKKHIPSWAVPVTETKKQTPVEVTEQTVPIQTPVEVTEQTVPIQTPVEVTEQTVPIQTPVEVTEQTVPIQTPIETTDELERLKDIAIEHDIFLTIAPNMTTEEQLKMFKTELRAKGIAF